VVGGVTVDNPARVGSSPLVLVNLPGEWAADALCAEADPDEWFPEKGGSTSRAKAICNRCAVVTDCLAFALSHNEPFGVWGGLTRRERRELQRTHNPPEKEQEVAA
jgi:WhiB family redox-sensing transcriptional regulator